MHIHILGICGTFMGSLAVLAKDSGHKVTGSDLNCYPPISEQLDEMGIEVIPNYDPDQLKMKPDLLVIGNVMTRGMKIIEHILDNDLPYTSGPKWLGENILADRTVISVSGTHGKTTTSSLITSILKDIGEDPGYLIGGVPINFEVSASLGSSSYFVIEADEYDTAFFDKRSKFIHYPSDILIINNLEFDHADIFNDIEQIKWHFHQLIRSLPSKTKILTPFQDLNVRSLLAMGNWSETQSFGMSEEADYSILNNSGMISIKENDAVERIISPELFGDHNLMNIISSYSALRSLGIESDKIIESINAFKGVKRRLQRLDQFKQNKVFDDFAHHPTSIEFGIKAIKEKYPNEKLCVIAELASNTMRQGTLKDDVIHSFEEADSVLILSDSGFEWDLKSEFKNLNNAIVTENIKDLDDELDRIDTDKINFLIMTNKSSVSIIESLEQRLNRT